VSNIDAAADSVEGLKPVVARIRQCWPAVKILLRGDGGFCREKLMAWCEREAMDYIFGLAQNALDRNAQFNRWLKYFASPVGQA
jgi:hypothetical protein